MMFTSKGNHKTKIFDTVETEGIAQRTFYWYFKSREQD